MLDIRGTTGNDRVSFHLADLTSLAQVRELAERILAEHDRLDVLVNNAGIGAGGRAVGERELNAAAALRRGR